MKKGRKTTLKERIDITGYCIEHGKNYGEVAKKFKISYSQIISWVKKYEMVGETGLVDRRGRNKPEAEMTSAEKQMYKKRLQRKEARKKEIETAIHKKLQKIEASGVKGHLKNKEKYKAIFELHAAKSYPISQLCVYADVGRASYYQWMRQYASAGKN